MSFHQNNLKIVRKLIKNKKNIFFKKFFKIQKQTNGFFVFSVNHQLGIQQYFHY
jgi:hypothetical protein